MTATPLTEVRARVAVRVPQRDGETLLESARRRLSRATAVEDLEIVEMCGLEPALAATVVRLEVEFVVPSTHDQQALVAELDETPGTERVERVQQV